MEGRVFRNPKRTHKGHMDKTKGEMDARTGGGFG